jgi:soluble lytic murein transglycosylase-like protein
MFRNLCLASTILVLAAGLAIPASARERRATLSDANGNLDLLIAKYASANGVPEALVRRVIKRESGGNPRVVSRGNYGLMQIKLATARSLGYGGGASGLLNAETNMNYAVKYLAGAYRVAGGNSDRAVHYYAAGYYFAAKRKGMTTAPGNGVAMRSFASLKHVPATALEVPSFATSSPASMNFH